jgi:oxalate decarboxylase
MSLTRKYQTIDRSQWIAGNPTNVRAANFSGPASLLDKFPRRQVFISLKDRP